ncbi:MAG TPA: phosphopantetheine-binding protein [Casimicrobiaceae bacterium]|nr:phosphopantetheine-binding protein [Casimicrobiaceae bacterium]
MTAEVSASAAPRPTRPRPALANAYVAPRSPLERALATHWEDVLAVAPVGVDDDFFDLGGESLHAFALIARAARDLGAALDARDLFTCPTVAGLAAMIGGRRPLA